MFIDIFSSEENNMLQFFGGHLFHTVPGMKQIHAIPCSMLVRLFRSCVQSARCDLNCLDSFGNGMQWS